jgi:nucleoid DNA-binding protein
MIKQEITDKISQFFRLSQFEAEKIVDDIFSKIMQGVKVDNLVDILNFGEFILKYDGKTSELPQSNYKKTIEFLQSPVLEEDIGHKNYDLLRPHYPTSSDEEKENKQEPDMKVNPEQQSKIITEKEEIFPEKSISTSSFEQIQEKHIVTEQKVEKSDEIKEKPVTQVEKPIVIHENPVTTNEILTSSGIETESSSLSLEDEFKKKREALLSKISIHPLQDSEAVKKPVLSSAKYNIPGYISSEGKSIEQIQRVENKESLPVSEKIQDVPPIGKMNENSVSDKIEDKQIGGNVDELKSDKATEPFLKPPQIPAIGSSLIEDDISNKSFADYFTELKGEEKKPEEIKAKPPEPIPQVIPKKAVELHQEITKTVTTTPIVIAPVVTTPVVTTPVVTAPVLTTPIVTAPVVTAPAVNIPVETAPVLAPESLQSESQSVERRSEDKSYYIWYKESEPNVNDTQTMSYEYELLYQATKEAEYQSKLKIYVSTFILFFSIVLILLIFSPVIYKFFFTPMEQQSIQNVEGQNSIDQNSENKASLNTIPETQNQNNQPNDTTNKTQPVTTEQTQQSQKNTQQTEQTNQSTQQSEPQQQNETKQQLQNQQQTQPNTEPKIEGVVKNSVGWADSKYNVIYIQLENGKFTIQESAFDSESKAKDRISKVEALKIEGLKGNAIKADLGTKGVWYRVRFGEFNTLEEARAKAIELRGKL